MKNVKRKTKTHQKSYDCILLRLAAVLAWFAPCIVYFIFHLFFLRRDTAFVFLGYFGAFFLGFALFVCVGSHKAAQLLKNGFSWKLFLPPLVFGAVLVTASLVLILVPQIYAFFSQQAVSDYFLLWFVLAVLALSYALFRPNVRLLLQCAGMRRADINRLLKHGKNFWWYEAARKRCPLGWLYFANKGFTLCFAGTAALHFFFGWWQPMRRIVGMLSAAALVCCAAMLFYAGWCTDFSLLNRQRKHFRLGGLLCFLTYCGFLLWIAAKELTTVVF